MESRNKKGSVLIVEDDRLLSLITERLLRKLGYEIAGKAVSAEEAIDLVRESAPDVVIMDIFLEGGMNGIDTVRQIRTFSEVPVIFISGTSNKRSFLQAKETGFVDFLVKPIMAVDLVGPLNRAMAESGKSDSVRTPLHSLYRAG